MAWAAPPAGADPNSPKAALYRALKDPAGFSCCSIADCRPASAWIEGGHWKARLNSDPQQIIDIPDDKVLHDQQSPEGLEAVLCLGYLSGEPIVRCFVPPGQV
jgi:hypothetical protein